MSGKYQALVQVAPGELCLVDIDENLVPDLIKAGFIPQPIDLALDTSTKAVGDLVGGWEASDADVAIEVASAIKHLRALCIERDSLKQECEQLRKLMVLGGK